MSPALHDGDVVLARFGAPVRPGDAVLVRWAERPEQLSVKRAVRPEGDGWWVRGDNTFAGGDSTDYGVVPEELVLARVRARYRPLAKGQRSVTAVLGWAEWVRNAIG